MKIIFKPTNKLVEKLILDERLILDEATTIFSSKTYSNYNNNLQQKLNTFLEDLIESTKNIKINKIQELINNTAEIEKNIRKLPNKTVSNIPLATELKESISKFLNDLKTFYSELKNSNIVDTSKDLTVINDLIKSLAPNQPRDIRAWLRAASQHNYVALQALFKNLNNIQQNITASISNNIISNIKNSINKFISSSNETNDSVTNFINEVIRKLNTTWVKDKYHEKFIEPFNTLDKKTNLALTEINNAVTDLTQYSNLIKFTSDGVKKINEQINNINAAQQEFLKTIQELGDSLQLQKDNDDTTKEETTFTANTDWAQKYKEIFTDKKTITKRGKNIEVYKSGWDRSKELDNFWEEYYTKVWPEQKEQVKNLGNAFKDECLKLGFNADKNPFLKFLKNLFTRNIYPEAKSYTEIHNCANKGIISSEDLIDTGKNINLVLYSKNLYEKSISEISAYLELYSKIKDKINTIKLSNSILIEKYDKDRQALLIDLFFEPGKPLADSKERISGKFTGNLKKFSDIEQEWKRLSGENITADRDEKINVSAEQIAKSVRDLNGAKQVIQFLLTNYNDNNKFISKDLVDKINNTCTIADEFIYSPSQAKTMAEKFNNFKNISAIMLDVIKTLIKKFFNTDLDTAQ